MEWIKSIQRAIDYIEEHITEDINYEDIAREAYSSPFHFQRTFSILCGFTVGDYIRMRRLSLAASDLIRSNDKVIDVALRYGYDTPESFTRAFVRFHGITPTEAKRGRNVKSFSRLSVKLILTGGSTMDYRIEKLGAFQVICKRKQVSKQNNWTATPDISAYWNECGANGTIQKIVSYIPEKPLLKGMLGICFLGGFKAEEFPYGIGVEYNGRPVVDDGLEIVDIPANTYAVFTCRGKMPDAFPETYKKIITEFFPQSNKYEYGHGIELEVYPSADVKNPDYICEIWIAVNEK
ncbi:MAG: AraC family transcriptional regulator [Ruminococcus flavefaciens]|nr:AraC family transcriptional regulator [Ruminococcus flavefaciens]MCM1228920.1 AraC family transcriptional regulator [Ruminococcus flavefaciens]